MIYRLHYSGLFGNYIEPEENAFQNIQLACIMSEFQKISTGKIQVYTSETSGGTDFPDFYYDDAVPLFSEPLYKKMLENGVDNFFAKEVNISDRIQKKSRKYIMALPPRIDAVDYERSEIRCITDGYEPLYEADKLVIDYRKTGNYQIFKLSNMLDNNIYITENLKRCLEQFSPDGMEMIPYDIL